ncbi:MAG: IS4 family transposase [Pyrinomonadaceae bacterium]|nr:IS4 family transposase [Pyrinomonadaceae bacterium]
MTSISTSIDQESSSQKLFFTDFVRKLFFAYLEQVGSLRSLPVELQSNRKCRELGLFYTPFSTLKDGFSRFQSKSFKLLFDTALGSLKLKQVECLDEIGLFRVIDGSLFPTLIQMRWSEYRKAKNAFKLHLSFELNRLIPTEFVLGSGKSSERTFLESVLEKGVTYIADRGYASFEIIAKLLKAEAYFVFRVKDNLLYEVQERLAIRTEELPLCFREVRDELIIFKNDKHRNKVRLIQFKVAGSYFRIITNRFDLRTLKIIVLYAYRWQIELFFKYLKRTFKGLHLFNHSQNGVEIQFYLLMTLALLLLKMKQDCQKLKPQKQKAQEKSEKKDESPSKWIRNISKIFYGSWKISKSWLQIIKNSLSKVIDNELLTMLNSC